MVRLSPSGMVYRLISRNRKAGPHVKDTLVVYGGDSMASCMAEVAAIWRMTKTKMYVGT